jgi:hypothetical protein
LFLFTRAYLVRDRVLASEKLSNLLLLGGREAVFAEERASLVFEAYLALAEL